MGRELVSIDKNNNNKKKTTTTKKKKTKKKKKNKNKKQTNKKTNKQIITFIYGCVQKHCWVKNYTIVNRKEGNDQELRQLPNTFRSKTTTGKKDALKVTSPQSKHYK